MTVEDLHLGFLVVMTILVIAVGLALNAWDAKNRK